MTFALVAAACGSDDDEAGAADTTTDAAAATSAFEHSQGSTDDPADPQRIATTTDQNALLPLLELGLAALDAKRADD